MASIRRRTWRTAKGERREAWQADFVDQSGARHQPQFSTRKAADTWLVRARSEVQAGVFTPDATSITIAIASELWLERCRNDNLERGTLKQYTSHVRCHIGPQIGSVKFSRLTMPVVESFVDGLLASGRSRMQAKKVLTSLKAIIKEAQRRGLVAQNVASVVSIRQARRHARKVKLPSKAEVKELIDRATGSTRPMLIMVVFTGLRASELRGLRWQDVDFEQRMVRVRQRADDYCRIGPLKSESSRRDIPMTPMVLNTLREWRLACPKGELDLVFPNPQGGVIQHKMLCKRLGRAHRFRHFFASWLIDQGFGPKRVQALLGHSTIQLTYDVYGHLFPQENDHERFAAGELALVGKG
jgi:integrase